jgi:hypothetical protein
MTYAPAYRTHKDDTSDILEWANDVVERLDVPKFSEESGTRPSETCDDEKEPLTVSGSHATAFAPALRNRGGAPAKLPPYLLSAVLKVILEIGFRGQIFTWTAVANALWFRYTEEQLAIIDLAGWRDPDRARQMKEGARLRGWSSVDGETQVRLHAIDDAKNRRIEASAKAYRAEVNRLQAAMDKQCRFMDDNSLPAGRRQPEKALTEARTAEMDARREVQRAFGNRLVWAALMSANAEYYPGVEAADLHAGLLRDYKGDVGVDEHQVAVASTHNNRRGSRVAKQLAKVHGHNRRYGAAHSIGFTGGIAVSRADSPKVPAVLLAYDLHDPASGAHSGARNVLQSIETSGLRPTLKSKAHQYVVGDKAYPSYIEFNEWLLANRWTMLGKFSTSTTDKRGGAPFADMAPQGTGPGPFQFNGPFLCPGIGAEYLHANAGFDIPWERNNLTPEWLKANDDTVTLLSAAVMPTDGRPKPRKHAGRGRPAADAKPLENTWTVDVFCPAAGARAKVRCPRVSTSLELPADKFPTLGHAPAANDPSAPECCTSKYGTMKLVLDKKHMKSWQPKMAGSWDHQDIYSPARTATESYFARLMDRDSGDLNMHKIEWQKNVFVALGIASTVLATNKRVIEKWQDDLRDNEGKAPRGLGERRRAHRQHLRSM